MVDQPIRPVIDISCGETYDTCLACHASYGQDIKNIRIKTTVFTLCKVCRVKLKELL